MRKLAAIVFIAMMAGPALAQEQQHMQGYREPDKEKTAAQQADEARAQRAYQRALNNVPDQKQADPWGIARSNDAPKAAVKPHSASKQGNPRNAAAK